MISERLGAGDELLGFIEVSFTPPLSNVKPRLGLGFVGFRRLRLVPEKTRQAVCGNYFFAGLREEGIQFREGSQAVSQQERSGEIRCYRSANGRKCDTSRL